jgi:hypothetical protein
MAFRRQDIPKTTRKSKEEGEPRRLYPRYARDRSLVPKVNLAIGYLDGMVGRKRGDLSAEVVLELFGDPKLARCMLACLSDSYRYRSLAFADVVGDEAALALAAWDLIEPADLRGHIYLAANEELGGFVPETERDPFLGRLAATLGLEPRDLDELIHLDAERNALLVRVGPRPDADDVVARYNATLTLSVLRHASAVTLDLPGLDATVVETVCTRRGVGWRRVGDETIRLAGRRDALGSWVRFGGHLARCAGQLIALCPRSPAGEGTIHLGDQTSRFVLDGPAVAGLRPKLRAAAGAEGTIAAAVLADDVTALRRKADNGAVGWTIRRSPDPIVVDGAIAFPELLCTRDQLAVAVVPVAACSARAASLAAMERIKAVRPVISLGADAIEGVPSLATPSATALLALLEEIADGVDQGASPIRIVAAELRAAGSVPTSRLVEILGQDALATRVRPLTDDGDAALVDGFGLCRVTLLDELLDRASVGPLDIAALRSNVAARLGDEAGADAVTLHLLSSYQRLLFEGVRTANPREAVDVRAA